MLLEELKWTELRGLEKRVFVVPLGAMEQHGPHLPLATDSTIITAIAQRVESQTADSIVLLPAQWLGHSPHHAHFGCVSLDLRPYMEMIQGICRSLARMGAQKILLLNGHGGNDVPCRAAMREFKGEKPQCQVAYATYWSLASKAMSEIRESPRGGMGHACEMETSVMLVIAADQVDMASARDDGTLGQTGYRLLDMLSPQPYYMVREFDELSKTGTLGMPSLASAEKGEKFLSAAVEGVVRFIRDFAGW